MPYSGGPDQLRVPSVYVDSVAAPAEAPFHIVPTAAPTGTQEAGNIYVNLTSGGLLVSNGVGFANAGGVRQVVTAAATLTAAQSGALCLLNAAAGFTYTLPAPVVGLWYDFLVTVTVTSVTAKIITDAASTFLLGGFLQTPDAAAVVVAWPANGTTIRAWNGNGTTTGGIIGDVVRAVCISATQWAVQGYGSATGTEATPFAVS